LSRHDDGAFRKLPSGGEHGPHECLRPDDDGGGPGNEGQEKDPDRGAIGGPKLAGDVLELADVTPGQGSSGGEGEDGTITEVVADFRGDAAHRPEGTVLRGTQCRYGPGEPKIGRGGIGEGSFGYVENGQRRAFGILQHQLGGAFGDRGGGDRQRDGNRPRRAVGELAPGGDRRGVRGGEVPGQRGVGTGEQQLQIP
jgi:hypothetical protein